MIKYFLGFIVITLIIYLIYSKVKVKEKFVKDFDDVLDNKCSLLTRDQLNDYNFNSGNCQSSSCPLETCYELQEDTQQAKPVPTFKYFTNIKEQRKQMNQDESFTCATNHNPDGNIFCNIDEPVCANLYDEKTCYEFTENPGSVDNKSWQPSTYIKSIDSKGDCLWINTNNNEDTKTDIEMNNCKEEPFTCDRRESCTTYNANTPFTDNYQYYIVDPKSSEGDTCIKDPNRSCYEDCPIGKVQVLYQFNPNDRTFDPQIFTKQQQTFKTSDEQDVDLCLFLNDGRCIPEKNSYSQFQLDGYDSDGPAASEYCGRVGYAGYINNDRTNSNVLFNSNIQCYEKKVKFCSNLNDRDELIKEKYIPTLNNSDPTKCKYTNVKKSLDIDGDPFVCPSFRACENSNQFRNIEKGYCTPCPKGKYLDPRDDSIYKFTVDTACKDVANCSQIDKCYVPYRGYDGEYHQNILIEKPFPQTHNPDKPWECMETYKGVCFTCPDGDIKVELDQDGNGNKFCSLCNEGNDEDSEVINEYDINFKTKQCEKVYDCGNNESTNLMKCFNKSTYTIHTHQLSNVDDKFTPCVYHKYYEKNGKITSDYMEKCPEPECPDNDFIKYRKVEYDEYDEYDDPKEICQDAYVDKNGESIGCTRCELPECTIQKIVETNYNDNTPPDTSYDPNNHNNYNILNYCGGKGFCKYIDGCDKDRSIVNCHDPLNREDYCNITSVKKTFKFISEYPNYDNTITKYDQCYYNQKTLDNATNLDDLDIQELGDEFGIYDTNKVVFTREIQSYSEGCPKHCGAEQEITKKGTPFKTAFDERTIVSEDDSVDLRENRFTKEYTRRNTCSDHDEPEKPGWIYDTFTVSAGEGRYGQDCKEYLREEMKNNEIFKYGDNSQCTSDIDATSTVVGKTGHSTCDLTQTSVDGNIEEWQIKKPYTLEACKISSTCLFTCKQSEKCESESSTNSCKIVQTCSQDDSDKDQSFGDGEGFDTCPCPPGTALDGTQCIKGESSQRDDNLLRTYKENDVWYAEYECPRDVNSCPDCPIGGETIYVIGNDDEVNRPLDESESWIVKDFWNIIDEQYVNTDSHELCYQDIQNNKDDTLYTIQKYHKDGDLCYDLVSKETRQKDEIESITPQKKLTKCDDEYLCADVKVIDGLNETNATAPTFIEGDLILMKDTDLKDEFKTCCVNSKDSISLCPEGKCKSSELDLNDAFALEQKDYNVKLCRKFKQDGINEIKDNPDPSEDDLQEVDKDTLFNSRYSHITVNRKGEIPKINYYNITSHQYTKQSPMYFVKTLGVDTYINMVGGTGIDCNDDYYYTESDCCNGKKIRTFNEGLLGAGVTDHGCDLSTEIDCEYGEVDTCLECVDDDYEKIDDLERGPAPLMNDSPTWQSYVQCPIVCDTTTTSTYERSKKINCKGDDVKNENCPPICQTCTENDYTDVNCPDPTDPTECGIPQNQIKKNLKDPNSCITTDADYSFCPATPNCLSACTPEDYEPVKPESNSQYDQAVYLASRTYNNKANCPSPCDPDGTAMFQQFKKEDNCIGDPSIPQSCPVCDECTEADYLPCPSSSDCSSSQGSSPEGDAILRPGVSCTEPSSKKRCPAVDCSCVYSSWGRWTPSTDKTCGTDVPQERTRSIDRGNDSYCTDKLIDDTLTPSVPCPCPISTAGYTTLDNNKQYRYYTTYKNWTRASKQCMDNGAKLITAKTADDKRILEEIKERCSPLSGTIWLGAIKHDDVYDTPNDRKRYKWIDSDTEYVNSSGLEWRTGEPNGDLHQGVYEAKIIEYNSGMNDTKVVDFENRFICMKEADGSATMTQEAIDFTNGTTPTPTPTPLRSCSTTTDYRNDTTSRNLCRDRSCANTATKYKKNKKRTANCQGNEEIEVFCPPRSRTCVTSTGLATSGSFTVTGTGTQYFR